MKNFKGYLLSATLLLSVLIFSCSPKPNPIKIWMSSADGSVLLEQQDVLHFNKSRNNDTGIVINEDKTFQEIDGFGASLTESSGYAISTLPQTQQDQLMLDLFSYDQGIGISFLRQPMGSSDFALSTYSYNDIEPGQTDFELNHFSIKRDFNYIIPYLLKALEINPDLKIMATPWSPPAWMKTGESMIGATGGTLKKECYQVYADYFVKFIEAYAALGINIYAVSVQNEVNYAPSSYAGMKISPQEEALFIGEYLGPALNTAGLDVKILCYDHNWDRVDLAIETLSNETANKYIAGTAWHYYGGEASAMSKIKELFPQKDIWFTEGSIGTWIGHGGFSSNFMYSMTQALEILNNRSKSIIWWNIALDETNGPIVFNNSANYGLVQIDSKNGKQVLPNRPSWYTLGHFSKFIKPGAVKIESEDLSGSIENAAFINPDGSKVIVLFNKYFSSTTKEIFWNGYSFTIDIPANSAISCIF